MRRCLAVAGLLAITLAVHAGRPAAPLVEPAETLLLPRAEDSLRFAVIGDSGTGGKEQYALGRWMERYREVLGFDLVLMLGDNIYGKETADDYRRKFELPYKPLLESGVKFYASLGNHDDTNQRDYERFNMQGKRYYSFRGARQSVRFFALDSNYMDPAQLEWLERELASAREEWKVCFFHHPIYSSGKRHGPDEALRAAIEPIFVRYKVDLVLSGHEHFYERLKPQKGIQYFISGGAGKLRRRGLRRTDLTDKSFDVGLHFMLFELSGKDLYVQVIGENGQTVDTVVIRKGNGTVLTEGEPAQAIQ